jgi:carboxylesterase type B
LGQYPDFVEDAANAIKWVKDNIEQFGGDISNVFLSGHSAGGL